MKSRMCMLVAMGMASLFLSACGGGGSASPPPPPSNVNEWTWVNGPNVVDQKGIYGTQGLAASSNVPGGRLASVTGVDASGDFWLFGGYGVDSIGGQAYLNDLWKYSAGQWTWVNGANVVDQKGIYGTQGTAASGNVPGAREGAVSWTDATGGFWLFGGVGYDSTGNLGPLNDLWRYSAGQWTWMSGSNLAYQPGTYGTKGMAAPDNVPGARYGAVSWIDTIGSLWLFGGSDSTTTNEDLNDLWKYSAGQWTWMSGSNLASQPGTYGTKGTAAPDNVPGARREAVSWTDASGNLWLFGGFGFIPTGGCCELNDLWRYSGGEWTWMGGANVFDQPGTYLTRGTPSPGNAPGAREGAVSWTDASGNFWLFGAVLGYGGPGRLSNLNDLWKYSAGEWTWVSGSSAVNQSGTYGTKGTPARGNVPGAGGGSASWTDASGNLWLFGGSRCDSTCNIGYLSDLWKYAP